MTDATDRAALIAEAKHWLLDPRDTHAGFLLVTDIYHALVQSERDLADARELGESYSRRLGKTVEQPVMNEERLRAKLSEQAAVIEAVKRELPLEASFEVDESNVRSLNAIRDILSGTPTTETTKDGEP